VDGWASCSRKRPPVDADLGDLGSRLREPDGQRLCRASGLPKDDGLIKNRYVGRTFIQPGQGCASTACG